MYKKIAILIVVIIIAVALGYWAGTSKIDSSSITKTVTEKTSTTTDDRLNLSYFFKDDAKSRIKSLSFQPEKFKKVFTVVATRPSEPWPEDGPETGIVFYILDSSHNDNDKLVVSYYGYGIPYYYGPYLVNVEDLKKEFDLLKVGEKIGDNYKIKSLEYTSTDDITEVNITNSFPLKY